MGHALICDTGALLGYLIESSPDHAAFRTAIDEARARFIPGLVLSEVDALLKDQPAAMRALVADIERGAFLYAPPTDAQLARAMAIDAQYPDLALGLVDASVVALAEELELARLATRDTDLFAAVRLEDGSAFELIGPSDRAPRRRRS